MKVVWLWPALSDLHRLEAFIRERDPARFGEISVLLREATRSLEQFPERCRRVPGSPDFRELFVEALSQIYIVQFRIAGDEVIIVRVWHGREGRS